MFNQISLSLKTMYLCSANVNATMVTYEWLNNKFWNVQGTFFFGKGNKQYNKLLQQEVSLGTCFSLQKTVANWNSY